VKQGVAPVARRQLLSEPAILTLITLGIWAIVWILITLLGGEKRAVVSVDEYGNTVAQRLRGRKETGRQRLRKGGGTPLGPTKRTI
jgi:hypothetical protein